jgi:hypothetical protein
MTRELETMTRASESRASISGGERSELGAGASCEAGGVRPASPTVAGGGRGPQRAEVDEAEAEEAEEAGASSTTAASASALQTPQSHVNPYCERRSERRSSSGFVGATYACVISSPAGMARSARMRTAVFARGAMAPGEPAALAAPPCPAALAASVAPATKP